MLLIAPCQQQWTKYWVKVRPVPVLGWKSCSKSPGNSASVVLMAGSEMQRLSSTFNTQIVFVQKKSAVLLRDLQPSRGWSLLLGCVCNVITLKERFGEMGKSDRTTKNVSQKGTDLVSRHHRVIFHGASPRFVLQTESNFHNQKRNEASYAIPNLLLIVSLPRNLSLLGYC